MMARLSDSELLILVRQVLLNNIRDCPVMCAEDIRKVLSSDHGIKYNNGKYFSKKLRYALYEDRENSIARSYVGGTIVYYLEDWKNAYSNNR